MQLSQLFRAPFPGLLYTGACFLIVGARTSSEGTWHVPGPSTVHTSPAESTLTGVETSAAAAAAEAAVASVTPRRPRRTEKKPIPDSLKDER